MRKAYRGLVGLLLLSTAAMAQDSFAVTGTVVPAELLKLNYGPMPAGIRAFDLSICNTAASKQSVVSSEIYQALAQSNPGLKPIGRQIMLAAILRNQRRSLVSVLNVVLNSTTSVLAILSGGRSAVPAGILAGGALGSLAAQQLFANLRPVLTADQVEKFENQVLEPALVLDGGSCVERTVFAAADDPKAVSHALNFHFR
jgi:hypothetical protein